MGRQLAYVADTTEDQSAELESVLVDVKKQFIISGFDRLRSSNEVRHTTKGVCQQFYCCSIRFVCARLVISQIFEKHIDLPIQVAHLK